MPNKSINRLKMTISTVLILFFVLLIVYADKFYQGTPSTYINPHFTQVSQKTDFTIDLETISVQINENNQGIVQYTVQGGDSLSKIASTFGVTVSHIQDINNLSSGVPIRPGQKLIISSEEEGLLYDDISEKINIIVFANKYDIDVEDLMSLNYIQDKTEMLYPRQELFLPIDQEHAYKVGLMERPKPVFKPKPTVVYKPVINKPTTTNTSSKPSSAQTAVTRSTSTKSAIISQWPDYRKVSNRFYAGHCTWYAAMETPEIFPYINENKQARPFGGNANQWYDNAKNAGFSVGQTPRVGAVVVYERGFRWAYAGHVGKVINYYPTEGKMIIRDMNWVGKFIVTERWEDVSNSNIKGYVYPPSEPRTPPA